MTNFQIKKVMTSDKINLLQKRSLIVKFMYDEEGIRNAENTTYSVYQFLDLYERGKFYYHSCKNFQKLYDEIKAKTNNITIQKTINK